MKRASRAKEVAAVILPNPVNKGMGSSLWQVFRILLYVAMMVAGKLFSSKGLPSLANILRNKPDGRGQETSYGKASAPCGITTLKIRG